MPDSVNKKCEWKHTWTTGPFSFDGIFRTVPCPKVPKEILSTGVDRLTPSPSLSDGSGRGGGGAGSKKFDVEGSEDEGSSNTVSSHRSSIEPTALRFFRRLRPFCSTWLFDEHSPALLSFVALCITLATSVRKHQVQFYGVKLLNKLARLYYCISYF